MMPRSDLEYWNRRENAGAIFANMRWTWRHIRAHAGPAALSLILIHILLGIQPALLIYVTRHLVDTVVDAAGGGPSDFDDILPWLIAFGLIQLAANDVMWHLRDVFHLRLEQNLTHVLGRRLLERSSRLPLLFFDVSETYDRLERARDPGRKPGRLFFNALHFSQAAITAVSVAAMFVPVSVWISVAMIGALIPLVLLEIRQSRMFMAFTYGETPEERRAGYVNRLLTGRLEQKETRLFGLDAPLTGRWRRIRQVLRERLLDQRQRQVIVSVPVTGFHVAVGMGVAVTLAFLLGDRVLTPGRFVALFQGVGDMLRAGGSLGFSSRELQARSAEVGYVREFFDHRDGNIPEDETTDVPSDAVSFPRPLRGGLIVENVHFTYPAPAAGDEAPSVLNGVSLRLAPGERVALVGDNGAGKSTLAKILLGLYAPTSGRVTADGIDYRDIDPESRAGAVSAAFQDYSRFEFTLGQSIGIGTLDGSGEGQASELWPSWLQPDMAVVTEAARRAGVDEIADRLPDGCDTPVGHVFDGGQGLSGGEWQRIAIARAFTRDPALLILDEPAAALDAMAEADLYRQFAELLHGRTALLISHRLGSARMAERILVLGHGRIVEDGCHDALVAKGGVYAGMWEEQASWYR